MTSPDLDPVPEADALEQQAPVVDEDPETALDPGTAEADEADLREQSMPVPADEDEDERPPS